MNENRRKILEMLAAGQISADEAERLMNALEAETAGPNASGAPNTGVPPKPKPKYLRVVVEAEHGPGHHRHGHAGPHKVNVRVPMQLLRAGVKLAALIPQEARDRVNEELRRRGTPFDISQIKPENLEELIENLDDVAVDVNDERHKAKVMLSCE